MSSLWWVGGWVGGWVAGWVGGWVCQRMGGWAGGCVFFFFFFYLPESEVLKDNVAGGPELEGGGRVLLLLELFLA